MHGEAKPKCGVWRRESLFQGQERREGPVPSKIPSLKDFSKAFSKAKLKRGVVGCCKLLGIGILCSYSCSYRLGHNVPVNLRQDRCYSLFCSHLCEWESVVPLKVREQALLYISGCRQHSVLVAKAIDTKAKVQGADPIWSHMCSSLLQENTAWIQGVGGALGSEATYPSSPTTSTQHGLDGLTLPPSQCILPLIT